MKQKRIYAVFLCLIMFCSLFTNLDYAMADTTEITAESDFQWDGTKIVKYNGSSSTVVIPVKATEIGGKAFELTRVEEVDLSQSSVKKLDDYAFSGAFFLNKVLVSPALEEIGKYAFSQENIASVNLGDAHNLKTIKDSAFSGAKITSLIIPEQVSVIGENAFNCEKLTTVEIKSNKNCLKGWMFNSCIGLKKITISGNITKIPAEAFKNLSSLETVVFPSTLVSIGANAFTNCDALTKVELPETLTEICTGAFSECDKLEKISFHSKYLSNIENLYCSDSPKLKEISLGDKLTNVPEYLFKNITSLETVTIPLSVKRVDDNLFYGCTNLKTVIVKNPDLSFFRSSIEKVKGYSSTDGSQSDLEYFLTARGATFESIGTYKKINVEYVSNTDSNETIEKHMYRTSPTIEKAPLENSLFERPGYYITTWNTLADGTGDEYEAGEYCSFSEDTTLYAQWAEQTYKITYVLNGGTLSKANPATYKISSTIGSLNAPTKTGYSFGGWYSDAACSKKVTGVALGSYGDKTFYAKWIPNTYKIVFNANGATKGKMSTLTGRKYGTSYTLPAVGFSKTNYHFAGWNTRKDGKGKTYANKASVKSLTSVNGGTVTLYAKWAINTYTIKYNGNKSTSGAMKSTTAKYGSTYTLTSNAFKRTGYTFRYWNTKADGKGKTYSNKTKVKNLTARNGVTVNLYAIWKANTYTIKFNANGGKGSMSALTSRNYGSSYTLTANKFTRSGYTFQGWNTKKDGTGIWYSNKASVKNLTSKNGGTVTLYAMWTYYNVKFVANGGTGSMTAMKCSYGRNYALTANRFTRTGYTFVGWNTKANGTGTSYKNRASIRNLSGTNKKTIILYAIWKPITYTISYNFGELTEVTNENATSYNVISEFVLTAPVKEGYTFEGWYLDSEFTTSITRINKGTTGNLVLYAKFTPVE